MHRLNVWYHWDRADDSRSATYDAVMVIGRYFPPPPALQQAALYKFRIYNAPIERRL